MANVKKSARVVDTDIVRLNHVGLSLKAIANLLGCHPATITLRLQALGVAPSDTRRSFMEQVFAGLTDVEQEWLSHHLFNNGIPISAYITSLIKADHRTAPELVPTPAVMPEMFQVKTTDDLLEEIAAELESAEIPMVEPEHVNQLELPFALPTMCATCGEAPEITDTGMCPGCLDQASAPKPTSIFR